MKIAVISGSHRENSQSLKVSKYCIELLRASGATAELISLSNNPFPFWDQSIWSEGPDKWQGGVFKKTFETLQGADGVVIVSPEWSGMVPPGLKNLFLLVGNTLAHKPGLIVGVSSGISGTWPVAELKVSSSKNTRLVYIPEHVIIRNIETLLNDGNPVDEADKWVRDRLAYSTEILIEYAKVLCSLRQSGKIDLVKFPNGM